MKEWYMENYTPNAVGGYESDAISEYAQSNFTDALLTEFADTVTLYNHDLSESKEIKVCIQGNTADTQLKTMERTVLAPIGTLKAGMYIYYEDAYWLVTGRPDNNKSYEKSTLYMCNWLLKWQNKNGDIISRWSVVQSASKYNDGEDGNKILVLGSDQFSVQVPIDEESIKIPRDVKFFIDYNSEDPTVYQLTNPSNVLYRYGENNGITNWIVKEIAYSPAENDLKYGVCEYKDSTTIQPTEPDETTILCTISGSNLLKIGTSKTYTAKFVDENGDIVDDVEFEWQLDCDFADKISQIADGLKLTLKVSDADYVGEEFALNVIVGDEIKATINIVIEERY